MNEKGGIWLGIFVILIGFGFTGIYIVIIEPFIQAFSTALGISSQALTIISGGALLVALITLYFAFTQNITLPWWTKQN